ncbi:MAG TPA: phosphotransferase family protein [Ilumatobacteraceae bacterium]|nr:phosphotransferase family protein [Ilumatobacteraceae bacterium]
MDTPELHSDLARARLGDWLTERTHSHVPLTVGGVTKPKSGFSAETAIIEVVGGQVPTKMVVRREVPDPAVYPQQVPGMTIEIDIQYRAMSELTTRGTVPLAPLIGYEADADLLGAPFFVMGFVDGDVPTESPPYTESGFFVEAQPAQRRQLIDAGLAQVAAIHALAPGSTFDWLRPVDQPAGTDQQLALWRRFTEAELRGRDFPLLSETFDWLHDNLPTEERVGLCWGDARPGNIIWREFAPACLTDFEAVSFGSPMQDLGWWLMFDRTMHPDGSRLPGDPTVDEQVAMYEAHAGRAATDIGFHTVFAAARYSTIVIRVMNRLVDRGDLPADQTIWLNNPAATALAELRAELT